jgi:hypothetical protein
MEKPEMAKSRSDNDWFFWIWLYALIALATWAAMPGCKPTAPGPTQGPIPTPSPSPTNDISAIVELVPVSHGDGWRWAILQDGSTIGFAQPGEQVCLKACVKRKD